MKFTVAILLCLAGASMSEIFDECIKPGNRCCPDGSIAVNGDMSSCANRLCYDMPLGSCKKAKKAGKLTEYACKYNLALKHCYYSCNTCENALAPPQEICEKKHPNQKCCWDGNVAVNGRCPPCEDKKITCRRFLRTNNNTCETNSYYKRISFNKLCPISCGLCR